MKVVNRVTASLLAMAMVSPALFAAAAPMSADQKKQMEQVVHDYLVQNPEVLIEASQVLQQKQQKTMQEQAKNSISQNANELFLGQLSIAGNPKGDVTLVEFFDYQCIHCKEMKPIVDALIKSDSNLRVIYREFPIFGKTSELASRAALAAAMQGKYVPMHQALMQIDKHLDETLVMNAAKSAGLDVAKLKKDMASKSVTEILDTNRKLAEKLHLMGTPAFIVASTPGGTFKAGSTPDFVPGAATQQALQDMIKKASA